MSFVQTTLLVLTLGYVVQAQNVTQGFDFQLFMVKFDNLEQMIGELKSDIRKQEETIDGLTNKFQQLQTDMRKQGETLDSHSTLLSTISDESTNNFQQLQTQIGQHAERTEYYYNNLVNLIKNGCEDSSVEQNNTELSRCQLQIADKLIDVNCEQNLYGGGWYVIQSRFDGSVDFFRNWTEYRNGFGVVDGEYWLGLENIHLLTSSRDYELLVHLEDFDGGTGFAQYSAFKIGSEQEEYPLKTLEYYGGTAGDSLAYHRHRKFSTHDRSNDDSPNGNCAVSFHAAWWYGNCASSNLNGMLINLRAGHIVFWSTFREFQGLKVARMMIREVSLL